MRLRSRAHAPSSSATSTPTIAPDRLRAALDADPALEVWTNGSVAGHLDGLLDDAGLAIVGSLLGERGPGTPTPFSRLAPGDSVEL